LENNNSDTLLVFQATGIKEWGIGQASAAGRRIELSWERKQKKNMGDRRSSVTCKTKK
jgi:hypothetical protein